MEKTIFDTGMYIIDKEYHILNCNDAIKKMYPKVKEGDLCYKTLALKDSPCPTCPLKTKDVSLFNPNIEKWIFANAAQMEYPGHGNCYSIHFNIRNDMHIENTFLVNASHDIRTPMNAIKGFTQMLKDKVEDDRHVINIVDKIEKSSDTLMKFFYDVLELSRIESGKEELEPVVVDLSIFMDKIKTIFDDEIEYSGIVFKQENHILNNLVWCDEVKLTKIIMNMISNAIKFTPLNGEIIFGIEQVPVNADEFAYFRFFVKDNGIGMSEDFRLHAFEQFEFDRDDKEKGVIGGGLGLCMIKKLTELMGGRCTLKSESGEGTEIAVIIKFNFADESVIEQEEDCEVQKDFSGKRILLVEDNDFNREVARFVLEKRNIIVEEAENGLVAFNKLMDSADGYYDMVLMDIQMPVMDGYTATKKIRCIDNKAISNIPIVAMTANAYKEDRDRCFEAGMNRHLSKPIESDVLMQVLAEFL